MDDESFNRAQTLAGFFVLYWVISAFVRHVVKEPPADVVGRELHDFYGQHVSFIHSTVGVAAALVVYFYEGGADYDALTLPRHTLVLGVWPKQHSLGYFCYDLIYAEIYQVHDNAMRLHHVCVCFGGAIMFFSPVGGSVAMSKP
jgi:hypothetical protein